MKDTGERDNKKSLSPLNLHSHISGFCKMLNWIKVSSTPALSCGSRGRAGDIASATAQVLTAVVDREASLKSNMRTVHDGVNQLLTEQHVWFVKQACRKSMQKEWRLSGDKSDSRKPGRAAGAPALGTHSEAFAPHSSWAAEPVSNTGQERWGVKPGVALLK